MEDKKEYRYVHMTIESPSGYVWHQSAPIIKNDVKFTINEYLNSLGNGYICCDYYLTLF